MNNLNASSADFNGGMTVWSPMNSTSPIRLKGKDMSELRAFVFERDEFTCQECRRRVLWHLAHLAHIVGRGRGGSDTAENTRVLCATCHGKEHNSGGKPCPSKR